jgi:two-component system cell cycle sensor histidine kinase/response regulator CckA
VLLRALERYGYRVCAAEDGDQAEQLAQRHAASLRLVITDVVLPGMSGQELARRLGEHSPGVSVLFISGYHGDDLARGGAIDPAAAFLHKPFSPQQLVERVSQVLVDG